ncbi:hypothetical protein FQN54_003597 [Arachnomyces sp. PD_36]|nr:hypothetical protein FQN54_003597 [Arachnomyces sp. PD_36]
MNSLALMTMALSSTVSAWSFYVGGETIARDEHDDVECGYAHGVPGDEIAYYEGALEDCTLGIFLDSNCEELFAAFYEEEKYTLKDEMWGYHVLCG